jgi:hypothetical protein
VVASREQPPTVRYSPLGLVLVRYVQILPLLLNTIIIVHFFYPRFNTTIQIITFRPCWRNAASPSSRYGVDYCNVFRFYFLSHRVLSVGVESHGGLIHAVYRKHPVVSARGSFNTVVACTGTSMHLSGNGIPNLILPVLLTNP